MKSAGITANMRFGCCVRIGQSANRPCAARLKAMLPLWLPHYEREYARLNPAVKQRLLGIRSMNSLLRDQGPLRPRSGVVVLKHWKRHRGCDLAGSRTNRWVRVELRGWACETTKRIIAL